ncbi:hypothetical protein LPJ61_004822 [Coemansia biformis]|uniref:Uncharacterized protein n=1 Tax=Coemansia biformis TaxID=1286918 RepID=A0A9W7Y8J7_9FUNG|nr:hypothetical protein LPJ61_004822 [Coemansia biformis]
MLIAAKETLGMYDDAVTHAKNRVLQIVEMQNDILPQHEIILLYAFSQFVMAMAVANEAQAAVNTALAQHTMACAISAAENAVVTCIDSAAAAAAASQNEQQSDEPPPMTWVPSEMELPAYRR